MVNNKLQIYKLQTTSYIFYISVTLKSALITDCAGTTSDINHNAVSSIGSIGVGIDSKKFSSRFLILTNLFFYFLINYL